MSEELKKLTQENKDLKETILALRAQFALRDNDYKQLLLQTNNGLAEHINQLNKQIAESDKQIVELKELIEEKRNKVVVVEEKKSPRVGFNFTPAETKTNNEGGFNINEDLMKANPHLRNRPNASHF